MANIFTTPAQHIAAVAATLCGEDLGGLGALVTRHLESEWQGGRGSTVAIPVPGAVPARVRSAGDKTTPIVSDEIDEQTIPVTLDDFVHSSVILSEKDMSLDIKDYAKQVLTPQADAIQRKSEASLAAVMMATPETAAITYDAAAPFKSFVAARKALRNNGVSAEAKLYAVVGTNVYADLLSADAGKGLDDSGKLRGFTEVRENSRIGADDFIVFVADAFVLAMVAPVVPDGATYGASVRTENGAVRVVKDYDSSTASDRSLVGAFIESAALPLAVVDEDNGTVDLVANGGAVRVNTAA